MSNDPKKKDDWGINQQDFDFGPPPQLQPQQPQYNYGQPQQQMPIYGVPPQKKGRGIGCWLLFISVLVCLPIVLVAVVMFGVFGQLGSTFGGLGGLIDTFSNMGPEMQAISGDVSRFDPIGSLTQVRAFAGQGAKLTGISAYYVRSDGTMDLTASYMPAPYTEYEFVREVERPTNAPPVGAGGTTNGQWYQPISIDASKPGVQRHVTSTGGGVSMSYNYVTQGLEKDVRDATTSFNDAILADPQCTFRDLWQIAIQNDAPRDAVATIRYNEDGYSFNIPGTVNLDFDEDCNLVE
jgi:hypothetical protein